MLGLLLLAGLAALGAGSLADGQHILWQGIDFQWERRLAGFETPHRLGSWASYIDSFSAGNATAPPSAVYHARFSPGVDGDFAHPALYYTSLNASQLQNHVVPVQGSWAFDVSDNSTTGEHPFAETLVRRTVSVPRPADVPAAPFSETEVVLAGFNITMVCDASCGTCNSNGDWVYSFNVSVAQCGTTSSSAAAQSPTGADSGADAVAVAPAGTTCVLEFGLGRGWTPTHGGGKPYNPCMRYSVEIFFAALFFDPVHARTTSDLVFANTTLFAPIETGMQMLPSLGGITPVFTGLTGFGWNLLATDGNADRGRYLERYAFSVTQPFRTAGEYAYGYTLGLADPAVTTVPSNAEYRIVTSTLYVDGGSSEVPLSTTLTARATVCEDDKATGFICTKHNMVPSLVDAVPITA